MIIGAIYDYFPLKSVDNNNFQSIKTFHLFFPPQKVSFHTATRSTSNSPPLGLVSSTRNSIPSPVTFAASSSTSASSEVAPVSTISVETTLDSAENGQTPESSRGSNPTSPPSRPLEKTNKPTPSVTPGSNGVKHTSTAANPPAVSQSPQGIE